MKIYTKKGDTGETGLIGGGRVSKTDPTIEVVGSLDELNALIGLAIAKWPSAQADPVFHAVQSALFDVGAEIASTAGQYPAKGLESLTERLEAWIDQHTDEMPPLRNFVLPGGTLVAAELHCARTTCRRIERQIAGREARPELSAFVNRLSDWLFCAARYANFVEGVEDVPWTGER